MMSLAPPSTEGVYGTVSEALTALNAFAATEGYTIVKKRSRLRGGVLRNVDLKCDKGNKKKTLYFRRFRGKAANEEFKAY
jgi:hypothetical protein